MVGTWSYRWHMDRTEQAIQLREWIETGRARQIRLDARVSQSDVAADCEVTPGAVVRWEQGKRMPRGRNIAAYHVILTVLSDRT